MVDKGKKRLKMIERALVNISMSNGDAVSCYADLYTAISHIQCIKRNLIHAEAIPCDDTLVPVS